MVGRRGKKAHLTGFTYSKYQYIHHNKATEAREGIKKTTGKGVAQEQAILRAPFGKEWIAGGELTKQRSHSTRSNTT